MSVYDLTFVFALLCLLLAVWCARKALQMNRVAAYWQRQAGEYADDATKWRLHRAARIRRDANRAIPQATLKAQTTAALAQKS